MACRNPPRSTHGRTSQLMSSKSTHGKSSLGCAGAHLLVAHCKRRPASRLASSGFCAPGAPASWVSEDVGYTREGGARIAVKVEARLRLGKDQVSGPPIHNRSRHLQVRVARVGPILRRRHHPHCAWSCRPREAQGGAQERGARAGVVARGSPSFCGLPPPPLSEATPPGSRELVVGAKAHLGWRHGLCHVGARRCSSGTLPCLC